LNHPFGLAFDSAGDLFVSDDGTGNIYKFTPGGARSIFANLPNYPHGLIFDSAGNLYVANFVLGSITKITPSGAQSTFASGLAGPNRMAFDSAGNLYVADYGSSSITKITPSGAQSTFASGLPLLANGVAVDSMNNVFVSVSASGSGEILKYTPSGVPSTFATGFEPGAMNFDTAGNLIVTGNNQIYEFAPDGGQRIIASGLTGAADVAIQPVPEPSLLGLLVIGTAMVIVRRQR
jgi:sugar lactone lactonase YvrE